MNDATLLYRQINPVWIIDDTVHALAFIPTRKDEGQLSVYDGDQISPENSWRHFTDTLGFNSGGVTAVTVAECRSQDLPVYDSPQSFPEHALIDFTGLSRGQVRRKAHALKEAANARGWLFGLVIHCKVGRYGR